MEKKYAKRLTRVLFFLIFKYNFKNRDMYSLNCDYYDREFDTIDELVDDVISSGMDPNYVIIYNGVGTGSMVIDFIQF